MHSSSHASAAEQLREAKKRIAALEEELARLRSTTPSPVTVSPAPRSAPNLKTRPLIMTRRAAAAAAAAAVNAVASDLTRRPSTVARSSLKISTPPSCSSSAISEPCESQAPAECSEVSRGASELSESPAASDKPRNLYSSNSQLATQSPADPMDESDDHETPLETLTPENPTSEPPSEKQVLLKDQNVLLAPSAAQAHSTAMQIDLAEDRDNVIKDLATQTSNSDKVDPQSPTRRRPPPLPVVKTASTKKERHNIVAKCTEPRPGQTRYWTEEEHERFLEAVAEYGEKAYVAISNYVETRTPKQVRTHAQKFQMKMARLAKQSIDAGEPVQMPAGMNPVVQLLNNGKPTLVPLHATGENSDTVGNSLYKGIPAQVPIIITVPPSKQTFGKKKATEKQKPTKPSPVKKEEPTTEEDKEEDALVKVSSTVTEETSSSLTDPYMDYIGGTSHSKVEMELENTFAARLCQTLQGSPTEAEPKDGGFLTSDRASHASGSTGDDDDDDLADLENLGEEDLSLTPFANASESWLLPDESELPTV